MKKTVVVCEFCGKQVTKDAKEVTRSLKLGRKFFCNNSCGAKFGNKKRHSYGTVERLCALCGKAFTTTENPRKMGSFCSRSCASKASTSLTEKRIEAARASGRANQGNLWKPAQTLKAREMWKYVELEKALELVPHEFEYALGNYVFDLALFDVSILVEFDGRYHNFVPQQTVDAEKEALANSLGFSVVHVKTDDTMVIPHTALSTLLTEHA
jgi:very-short-patch-repair endonuclease